MAQTTYAGTLTATTFQGSGALLTTGTIPRTSLQTGTGGALYNNVSGNITSETYLDVSRGGTGAGATLSGMIQGNGSSAMTAIQGTQYAVTYWSAPSTISSVSAGTAGNLLQFNNSGAPSWVTPSTVIALGANGGLSWSGGGTTLSLVTPVTLANGGTGTGTFAGYGVVKLAQFATSMTAGLVGSSDVSSINGSQVSISASNGSVVTINSNALQATTSLAFSQGGTGATSISAGLVTSNGTALSGATGSAGGVIYWSSSTAIGNAVGSAGNILVSNGTSAPTWSAPTSVVQAGNNLAYAGSSLGISAPVTLSNGGTGSTTSSVVQNSVVMFNNGATSYSYGLLTDPYISSVAIGKITTGTNGVVISAAGSLSTQAPLSVANGGVGSTGITGLVLGSGTAYSGVSGTALGDIPYWTTPSNTLTFLTIGANGTVLTSNGTTPSWTNLTGSLSVALPLYVSANVLHMPDPLGIANGGTGASLSSSGVLDRVALMPVSATAFTLGQITNAYVSATANINGSKISMGTTVGNSGVVVTTLSSGNYVLATTAQLGLTLGGTNASLSNGGSLTTALALAPSATSVSQVNIDTSNSNSSIVQRDSSGRISVSGITEPSTAGAVTTAAPTTSQTMSACGHTTTSVGTLTATIATITTAVGYCGMVHCYFAVADVTGVQNGVIETVYRWVRVAGGLTLNTTPAMTVIDVATGSPSNYSVTASNSSNNVLITVNQGGSTTQQLYWTGKFKIVHGALA